LRQLRRRQRRQTRRFRLSRLVDTQIDGGEGVGDAEHRLRRA
jgi:hypothetical protein